MIEQLEVFNEWCQKEKKINLHVWIREYAQTNIPNIVYLDDVLTFLSNLTGTTVSKLKNDKAGRDSTIVRARGYLVKYAQIQLGFKSKSVYRQLFGFYRDHATALHYKNSEFFGEEKKIYDKLVTFIEDNKVIWHERDII
jgi:hypothetical protein